MLAHGLPRAVNITGGYRLENLFVRRHDSFEQALLIAHHGSHFGQHVTDGIEQQDHERVMRGLAEAPMELRIFQGELRGVGGRGLHLFTNPGQIPHVALCTLVRGERGILHFENGTDLMQVLDANLVAAHAEKQPQWFHHLGPADGAHRCADSMARFEQTPGSEDAYGFSHYGTADAELLGELALGWQPRAYGKAPADNLLLDSGHHSIDQAIFPADHLKSRFRASRDGSHVVWGTIRKRLYGGGGFAVNRLVVRGKTTNFLFRMSWLQELVLTLIFSCPKIDPNLTGERMSDFVGRERIWIGCDHGGYELKLLLVEQLEKKSIAVHDAGCHSADIVRYSYFAAQVVEAILRGEASRGILICSTGIGMSIIANKHPGIRASLCTSVHMGRMTRAHNDSNVLCLGGKITGVSEALDILEAWLTTPYEGGRHDISLDLIQQAEKVLSRGGVWNPPDPMAVSH